MRPSGTFWFRVYETGSSKVWSSALTHPVKGPPPLRFESENSFLAFDAVFPALEINQLGDEITHSWEIFRVPKLRAQWYCFPYCIAQKLAHSLFQFCQLTNTPIIEWEGILHHMYGLLRRAYILLAATYPTPLFYDLSLLVAALSFVNHQNRR